MWLEASGVKGEVFYESKIPEIRGVKDFKLFFFEYIEIFH